MVERSTGTAPGALSAAAFVAGLAEGPRKRDAETLLPWFARVSGFEPVLWRDSIVGYGRYRYRYDSGREGEYLMCGFSPRRRATTVYVLPGYRFGEMSERFARLGRHRLGKSCIYLERLDDVDLDVLGEIVTDGIEYLRANHETADR